MLAYRPAGARPVWLALALLAVSGGAEAAEAQARTPAAEVPPPPPPPEMHRTFPRFERGAQELGVVAGYGLGLDFGASQSGDTRLVAVLPHWGVALTHPYGADRAFAGSLSLLVEGVYLRSLDPHRGNSGGANLIFRNHFLALGRFVPFLELGAGMASVDFDLEQQRDGFDFMLETGAGAHIFLARRVTLTLEWRLHHISNAGIHTPNEGINTSHFLGGLSFFVGR